MLTVLGSLLGGGAVATILLGVVDRVRNRKYDKTKQTNNLKLDDATLIEIQKRAEQSQSSNMMAVGAFWSGQFMELSKQFEREQESNKQRWQRLMDRMHQHKAWDEKVMESLRECGMTVDAPPPSLDPDEPN